MTSEERLLELARQVGTADVVDAMGRLHRHRCQLLDLASPTPGRLLFGRAVTMSFFPTCEAAMPSAKFDFVDVFDRAVRGTAGGGVLVMAANGYTDTSLGGGTKLSRVQGAGLAGVLTDGRVRDFEELAGYDMAVYCSGEAVKWGGDTVTPYEVNRPVVVGGVGVRPGDHIFADGAGAVVIPRGQVQTVLLDAVRTKDSEARLAVEWRAGARGDTD